MNEIILDFQTSKGIIAPEIYGHFTEHIGGVFYDGLWVGEDSLIENIRGFRKKLVDSFRRLNPPVLRWPGGCFAETYNWRDGIGRRNERPVRANWWYSWDQHLESNAVGTHEFMDFCRMVGAEPYVAANITSMTPLDIRDWIEYCNFPANSTTLAAQRVKNGNEAPFDVAFWGIGNENWGGGGQMTPEMYADEFVRYATICNSLNRGGLKFIAGGANRHDIAWTRRMLERFAKRGRLSVPVWGMSVHYYVTPNPKTDPIRFTEDEWYVQLMHADYMRAIIDDHRAAMDEFDPERKLTLVIDEWGNWHIDGTGPSKGGNLFEQQSNMRDAMVTALTLNLFNNRADIVKMANVAQLCNNLHSLYLAGGEHCIETPNYHVFDLFKTHQGGRHVQATVHTDVLEKPSMKPLEMLSVSASEKESTLTVTIANLDIAASRTVRISSLGKPLPKSGVMRVLAHAEPRTCNTFENPGAVMPTDASVTFAGDACVTVPAAGIVTLLLHDEKETENA